MAQKPSVPQTVPNAKESPASPSWLFLFYQWVKQTISGIAGGAAGDVLYSDGADGVSHEAAFNYNATTNALSVGSVSATTTLAAGTTVTAGTGITATTGNITATAGNFVLTAGYIDLAEIADPGLAAANHVYLHAEDVAGVTQVHQNNSQHKWAVGQDSYIVARNTSGGNITKGQAVYVTGSTGARPEIALADADNHHHALGIAQDTMSNNGYGAVVVQGYCKELDTSAFVAGDRLYVSGTAGGLTTTRPTFPAAAQPIAVVIYAHATQGILFVHHHSDSRDSDGAWDTPFSIGDGSTAGELRLLEPSGTQYTAFKTQAQAGNVTYTLPAADAAVAGYALKSDGAGTLSWGTAGGEELKKSIAQAGHGFSVGNVVYYNGSSYALADADSEATAEVIGIVSAVADTDNFTLLYGGYISGLSGLTAGAVHFLSATAGALTTTEPSTAGQISKPLLIAISTTAGYFFNMRGQEIGGGVAGVREITSGTATAGQTTISVAYTPGYVDVYVNGVRLLADDYTATNGTSIVLDTGMALSDEYVVVVWNVVALAQIVAPTLPGGRLTLTSGTPVMSAEAAAQTTIYYTPYVGDLIPIYDGTAWNMKRFAELSMVMGGSANWASGSNYDLYVVNDGGTLRLGTGAAWTNDTTRSESLTRVNGILTNAATMTLRYGASSTVSVPANRATYVGTFRASANGTTTWELGGAAAGGDPGKLFLWNCYNRVLTHVMVRDSTDTWTTSGASIGTLNGSSTNRVTYVSGLDEDSFIADSRFRLTLVADAAPNNSANAIVGLGFDSTSAFSGEFFNSVNVLASSTFNQPAVAMLWNDIGIGMHYVQGLQWGSVAGASTATIAGDAGAPTLVFSGITFAGMF